MRCLTADMQYRATLGKLSWDFTGLHFHNALPLQYFDVMIILVSLLHNAFARNISLHPSRTSLALSRGRFWTVAKEANVLLKSASDTFHQQNNMQERENCVGEPPHNPIYLPRSILKDLYWWLLCQSWIYSAVPWWYGQFSCKYSQ